MARTLILILFFVFLGTQPMLFAQEVATNTTSNQVGVQNEPGGPAAEVPPAVPVEETSLAAAENVQWVWGEVIEVDKAASKIKVRYLDYESDAEKEEFFIIDKDTQLENLNSIADINITDSVGIDYTLDKDGQRTVKSISVEKASPSLKQP